ncbi:MAG: amino acid ABC transporter ATP-binding protein [Oscillospiraceae bacterium]|nr:amino acid ABC transporter ATP-binding protein [Oscillospiraceae bacterium]
MSENVIEVSHLHKQFGDNVILGDLSLSVNKGEVVVLIGPSGCGKSTLLRCLNGLEPIQGGTVSLHGEPVEYGKSSLTRIRQKIGMVFQNYDLFPHMTVMDNILLAPLKVQKRSKDEARAEALTLLERVGLKEKADTYPSELSGGQKQRVAIVRSLIIHPDIILLDEITAALDPEMVHEVLNVVLDLAKSGTTMMIVTHEMAFAEAAADRIIFLDGGSIVEEGEPHEFFRCPKTERAQRFLKTFTYTDS